MNKGWQRILLLIIPYFIFVIVFQYIGSLLIKVNYGAFNKTPLEELVILFFGSAGTFLVLWLFMKFIDKDKFINIGFHIKNRVKDIFIGFFLGAIIMFIGFATLLLSNQIDFVKTSFNLSNLSISISTYTLVAIVEETLFRGYILKNFMLSFNKYSALILSSILFSFAHAANENFDLFAFFDLFIAGILLGQTYIFTKNLWFPIAFHFSWNFFQTHFGFNVSGHDSYSLIEFNIKENNLLNGGDFGFEGSILSIIAQLITIITIQIYFYKQRIN